MLDSAGAEPLRKPCPPEKPANVYEMMNCALRAVKNLRNPTRLSDSLLEAQQCALVSEKVQQVLAALRKRGEQAVQEYRLWDQNVRAGTIFLDTHTALILYCDELSNLLERNHTARVEQFMQESAAYQAWIDDQERLKELNA